MLLVKGRVQLISELSSPLPEPASLRASTNDAPWKSPGKRRTCELMNACSLLSSSNSKPKIENKEHSSTSENGQLSVHEAMSSYKDISRGVIRLIQKRTFLSHCLKIPTYWDGNKGKEC